MRTLQSWKSSTSNSTTKATSTGSGSTTKATSFLSPTSSILPSSGVRTAINVVATAGNLLGHRVDPQLLLVRLVRIVLVYGRSRGAPQAGAHLQVRPRHLLQPAGAGDGVAEPGPRARGRVALGEQDEDTLHKL